MAWRQWYKRRGSNYVSRRAIHLLERYSFAPSKAADRTLRCIAVLHEYGCMPTLPTPGSLVVKHPDLCRKIQSLGAELAVHGYKHVDLKTYATNDAHTQLFQAIQAFKQNGIAAHGFRCPYLSCHDDMIADLPEGIFSYSSNKTIEWSLSATNGHDQLATYATLQRLYCPKPASEQPAVPWTLKNGVVEIPVCIPDDLQLYDGLSLGVDGVAACWLEILEKTYQRGDLFNLIFHPEIALECETGFKAILNRARQFQPGVWFARLHEIAVWWREKDGFSVEIGQEADMLRLSFHCSERATILSKGLDLGDVGKPWGFGYQQLLSREIAVPQPYPFIGLGNDVPAEVGAFLREQGYILLTGERAKLCAVCLDSNILANLKHKMAILDYIESQSGPLIRFGRWPDGARSALSITGDLDALSLWDYLARIRHP